MRLLYLFCLLCVASLAQADDEMQRWKQQQMEMMQQQTADFSEYKTSIDAEFQSFLAAQWREMALYKGRVRDVTPKPKVLPRVKALPAIVSITPPPPRVTIPSLNLPPEVKPDNSSIPLTPLPEPSPIADIPTFEEIPEIPQTLKIAPIAAAPVIDDTLDTRLLVTFLGLDLTLSYDSRMAYPYNARPDSKSIANYWRELSSSESSKFVKQLQSIAVRQKLNDWGYLMLIHEVANGLHPDDENSRAMLSWFLLIKSGIQSRVGYNQRHVLLFMPSQQRVYEQGYLHINNDKYYVYFLPDGETLSNIYTYEGDYPAELRQFDFSMGNTPLTGQRVHYRQVDFTYEGTSHSLSIAVDQSLVGFYDSYPQLDIAWYFNVPVGGMTRQGLLNSLRPLVDDMSQQAALNLILGLVQNAFPYQTDDEQFGSENYLLPEETLFYPYSDCEDRSVLFAWLVRNLLNVEVIGLSYPGHVATAVKISGIEGDHVNYRGVKFVVADPTYIGARIGMAMPNFRSIQPVVIPLASGAVYQ